MKKQKRILSLITVLIILVISSSCGSKTSDEEMILTAESIAGTMSSVQLTEIAKNSPTDTTAPTQTKKATETFFVPTLSTVMPGTTPEPTSKVCLAASLVSETNVDGTLRMPGESFTQTWVFRNTGNCAWNENYSLVWVSDGRGVKMSTVERMPFPGYVAPGESIPFSVYFTSPTAPGPWSSFFQLESPNGTRFGPPPNNIFWVNVVVAEATGLPVSKTIKGTIWSTRSDGKTEENLYVGDNDENLVQTAHGIFSTEGIPRNAVLSYIGLNIGGTYRGNPFGNLGCLNISNAGTGQIMWSLCNLGDFQYGDTIQGDATALAAGQSGIYARSLNLEFNFEIPTNSDDAPDRLLISYATIQFVYNVP
jgi:hypothetical protein